MLRRHTIAEAARASRHAEAVHCAVAPLLCGKDTLGIYTGFLERMNAIIQTAPGDRSRETEETRALNTIAARAATKPIAAILDDPETARRLAAIARGEKPV